MTDYRPKKELTPEERIKIEELIERIYADPEFRKAMKKLADA